MGIDDKRFASGKNEASLTGMRRRQTTKVTVCLMLNKPKAWMPMAQLRVTFHRATAGREEALRTHPWS